MRAGRQKGVRYIIVNSLSLVLCSLAVVTASNSSASALLNLEVPSPIKLESPTIVKRLTSRVPVVSSLLDPPEDTPTIKPQTPSRQESSPQPSENATSEKKKPTKSSEKQETSPSAQPAAATMPAIQQQGSQFNTLQPVGAPYFEGNARLASVTLGPSVKTAAVLEPSEEGWRLFGIAWYWWMTLLAVIAGITLWRERLLTLVLTNRERWGV